MKTTLFIFVFGCVLSSAGASCCGAKKQVSQTSAPEAQTIVTPAYKVGTLTKRFLAVVEQDVKEKGGQLTGYTPSSAIVKEFGLREQTGDFMFSGFIKTGSSFDPTSVENIGGSSGAPAGGMRTISVPVRQVNAFLQLNAIEYFELGSQAQNK